MSDDSSKDLPPWHILGGNLRSSFRRTLRVRLHSGARFPSQTVLGEEGLPSDSLQRKGGWGIAAITLVATVVIFFASQFIGGLALSVVPILRHWSSQQANDWLTNSVGAQFVFGLLAYGLVIVGVGLMLKLLHWSWADIALKWPKLWHIVVGVLAAIPYYVLYIVIVEVVSALVPSFNINQKQDIGFNSVHGTLPLILTFISLVVIPPLAEEIVMRGFLYTGLRKVLPKIISALLVSSVFGAAHLAEGGASGPLWVGAIDTFILSLVLVFLREKTGNLWAGITLHAVKNGIAFVTIFIFNVR